MYIIILLMSFLSFGLLIYYIMFIMEFLDGEIDNKKEFQKRLIPFYTLVKSLKNKYEELN